MRLDGRQSSSVPTRGLDASLVRLRASARVCSPPRRARPWEDVRTIASAVRLRPGAAELSLGRGDDRAGYASSRGFLAPDAALSLLGARSGRSRVAASGTSTTSAPSGRGRSPTTPAGYSTPDGARAIGQRGLAERLGLLDWRGPAPHLDTRPVGAVVHVEPGRVVVRTMPCHPRKTPSRRRGNPSSESRSGVSGGGSRRSARTPGVAAVHKVVAITEEFADPYRRSAERRPTTTPGRRSSRWPRRHPPSRRRSRRGR